MKKSGKRQKKKRCLLFRVIAGFLKLVFVLALIFILSVAGINGYMIFRTSGDILTKEEAADLEDVDYIVVLGASVYGMKPSPVLKDRLDVGVTLYHSGVSDQLLMSGDNRVSDYNEVGAMQLYAENAGVPEEQIVLDPQGLCTYDSVKHLTESYHADKVVIVTQRYHMYRALYIADQLGIEAYGVSPVRKEESVKNTHELREIAARCKDFLLLLFGSDSDTVFDTLSREITELADQY